MGFKNCLRVRDMYIIYIFEQIIAVPEYPEPLNMIQGEAMKADGIGLKEERNRGRYEEV